MNAQKGAELPVGVAVKPLTPGIGCEIFGWDLRQPIGSAARDALLELFVERAVLVFREQTLDREQHKAFARHFGELHTHPSRRETRGDPHIFKVQAGADSVLNNGGVWHSDLSCEPNPPLGSALLLHELPAGGGGDTLFSNMCIVFEHLSPALKTLLRGLTAWHDIRRDLRQYGVTPVAGKHYSNANHPVVVNHPVSKRELLLVNGAFTERINELAPAESAALLGFLQTRIAQDARAQCRVRWEAGTLVVWDNRSTQHNAVWDYFPERRYGERVSIIDPQPPAQLPDSA